MERDHLPLVVEDRRARRAGFGVGAVVEVSVEDVDQRVLPQCDHLLVAARVLDDGGELADHDGALRLGQ